MPLDAKWTININTEALREKVRHQIFLGTQEIFEKDIKPDAQRNTPVLTGNNRRMIDVDVIETAEGTRADLYSQSGYGGYLELGTKKMPARPYLYPAFQKFIGRLSEVIGAKLRAYRSWGG